ncbi:hypothetical protein GY184_000870 [Listeria monocytogenes]|uniref:Uncharacterized protein n=1 Tax=Listeria monocytogenes TaxID=1639 RepID=A0A6C8EM21_LISMN|nr:hypothetical protein [Listeria monocytogenes]EFF98596.1 predicted protein [Listeria monocytogenes J2818]EDO1205378.1 hypothetical protein [Listeria monocytogenes]EDO1208241.1 hypothetical protein [Listeria monocytogenes]EDO1225426.1 hypothetical protein [Listeria monocytogenes]
MINFKCLMLYQALFLLLFIRYCEMSINVELFFVNCIQNGDLLYKKEVILWL